MRKEIINFILLVSLIAGGIISGILISQYRAEIIRLDEAVISVSQRYQDAISEIDQLSSELEETGSLPFQNVQIPITGNPTFSSLEAQLEDSNSQIEALEMRLGKRKMCDITIDSVDMSSLDLANSSIEEFINEHDNQVTEDPYWVTIWDYYFDITEHGFYGDDGLFWYYLVYKDSFEAGIYSVEDGCWIYSE